MSKGYVTGFCRLGFGPAPQLFYLAKFMHPAKVRLTLHLTVMAPRREEGWDCALAREYRALKPDPIEKPGRYLRGSFGTAPRLFGMRVEFPPIEIETALPEVVCRQGELAIYDDTAWLEGYAGLNDGIYVFGLMWLPAAPAERKR